MQQKQLSRKNVLVGGQDFAEVNNVEGPDDHGGEGFAEVVEAVYIGAEAEVECLPSPYSRSVFCFGSAHNKKGACLGVGEQDDCEHEKPNRAVRSALRGGG